VLDFQLGAFYKDVMKSKLSFPESYGADKFVILQASDLCGFLDAKISAFLDRVDKNLNKKDLKRNLSDTDCWLDAKQAAQYCAMSPGTFDKYRYETTPKLEGSKIDGKTLYKKSALDLFIMTYRERSLGLC
jgi:hypothetical protein